MPLESTGSDADFTPDSDTPLIDRELILGLILLPPILFLAMGPMLGLSIDTWLDARTSQVLQLLLTSVLLITCGHSIFSRGMKSLFSGHLNMFTLITIGVTAAYIFSATATLFPGFFPKEFHDPKTSLVHSFFDACAVIIVLVLIGQILENLARVKTGSELRSLLSLAPTTARLVSEHEEKDVPLRDVHPGDHLRVRPGETIPVDGTVTEGTSFVDESFITGEPSPIMKKRNDKVVAGTRNGRGSFILLAKKTGSETLLARIITLVRTAQRSRAPVQKMADTVAGVFIPIVLSIALATFIGWLLLGSQPSLPYAIVSSVSVLVIACPCAIGLATPMSIIVGIGRAAGEGVLFKDAESLETLGQSKQLMIDKTGTITAGRPTVTDVIVFGNQTEQEVLSFAAAIELKSEHPIAIAICQAASRYRLKTLQEADSFLATAGNGVEGTVAGKAVGLGNEAFLKKQQVSSNELADFQKAAKPLRANGKTITGVVIDHRIAGLLAITDPVKPGAQSAIYQLKRLGLTVTMLTGDHSDSANVIARTVGIDHYKASLTPQEKHRLITESHAHGEQPIMVGDGVNDAPALAAATVGIAMGTGSDVAIETADVTLIRGDLQLLPHAIQLSRATLLNIRQNLFLAFIYNVLGIPLAAGILVPVLGSNWQVTPIFAAAAMSLSSVFVITNALRLRTATICTDTNQITL
jgi:Cu+-exporting ATPase